MVAILKAQPTKKKPKTPRSNATTAAVRESQASQSQADAVKSNNKKNEK
jgi:hypothetical protein